MREIIRVRPVRFHTDGGNIGYIRITSFNEQTTDGLRKAIAEISKEIPQDKLAGYVIDLRNNPGGLLDQAVSVSSAFMARGEVVSTRGRTPEETQRFTARGGDMTKGKPLVVLINGGSASASEIVAGALHDHKRATLIGTRSFGKGSVQTIIPLGSGNGALALTTARYFTPSGHSIQAQGIAPDIEVLQDVPDELKTRAEIKGEASMRGHLAGRRRRADRLAGLCSAGREGRQGAARGLQPAARRHRQCRRAGVAEAADSELGAVVLDQAVPSDSGPGALRARLRCATADSASCRWARKQLPDSAAGFGALNR